MLLSNTSMAPKASTQRFHAQHEQLQADNCALCQKQRLGIAYALLILQDGGAGVAIIVGVFIALHCLVGLRVALNGLAQNFVHIGLARQAVAQAAFVLLGERHVFHGHGEGNVGDGFLDPRPQANEGEGRSTRW